MVDIPNIDFERNGESLSSQEQIALLKNELSEIQIRLKSSEERFSLMNEAYNERISELKGTIRFFENMISQILSITPEGEEKSRIIASIKDTISIQNQVKDRVNEIVL